MIPENATPVEIEIDVEGLRRKYTEERQKRLRINEADPPDLKGKFADFDRDLYVDASFTRATVIEDTDVLIIGGGLGGLMTGARLREKGMRKLRIIEKAGDFGGTWYWNRYPGCACDVESYIYLPLLEETGYVPTERYTKASEIRAYLKNLAERFDLYPAALFQTIVTELRWDKERKRWIGRTNRNDEIAARFVVSCTGVLSNPKLPNIPGVETFKGHSFHTSRWDYAYTGGGESGNMTGLEDKTVGIIGTGATSIQAIPHLAQWVQNLYVFQRTPSSVDERGNRPTDREWFKALEPGWQGARRHNFSSILSGSPEPVDLVEDGWTDIVRHVSAPVVGDSKPTSAEDMEIAGLKKMEMVRRRIERTVKDKATAEALKPYYHYFCKRPGFHDEYLDAFNRPNVTLVDIGGRGIERITPTGVLVRGKEYLLDCLIYATGFDFLMEYTREAGLEAYGREGVSLSEHWKEGPRTLFAVQTDLFPNLFFIRLSQAGHAANYTHLVDEQSSYIAHVIDQCMARGGSTVEATREAVNDWVEEVVAKAAPRQAFLATCTPGQYNHESNPQRERFSILNELYGGGAIAYFKILSDMRATGKLKGLTFSGT